MKKCNYCDSEFDEVAQVLEVISSRCGKEKHHDYFCCGACLTLHELQLSIKLAISVKDGPASILLATTELALIEMLNTNYDEINNSVLKKRQEIESQELKDLFKKS